MKTIKILVGNIGSGKTTWINKNKKSNEIVISRDSLRYMIGGGNYIFSQITEPFIWKGEKLLLKEAMKLEYNIIVDEVGINKKLRKRYVDLAKKYGYEIIAIKTPKLSMKQCVDRRMRNPHHQPNREIWETVWKKFDIAYEKPEKSEGFYKIIEIK